VNDRPYVASSLLSVALAHAFGSALNGKCREKPELAEAKLPLEATLVALRGGERVVNALFAPLGYEIETERHGSILSLTLRGELRLSDLLSHLYVLVPVLDDGKHYYVGLDEVEKLVTRGEGWLATHPARTMIAERYLRRQRHLTREALARLTSDPDPDETAEAQDEAEEALERPVSLDQRRRDAVLAALREADARRVLDLGCGQGKLVRALLDEGRVESIVGVDVSARSLEIAAQRLERSAAHKRERVQLFLGSALYRDARFSGFDAITLVEVIEHIDAQRIPALERVVFEHAAPPLVIVTTPNREHNARFAGLRPGEHRHRDHRFEWTRAEMRAWAESVSVRFGYNVSFAAIGEPDPELGPPTQMALFRRGAR
jgi:3' terminal RNA ribose 2'-O-methyltransferase Hen1